MKVLSKYGWVGEFALMLEATDEDIEAIKNNPNYFQDKLFINKLNKQKADNIIVLMINCKGVDLILSKIKELLIDYKAIYWYNRKQDRLFVKRR